MNGNEDKSMVAAVAAADSDDAMVTTLSEELDQKLQQLDDKMQQLTTAVHRVKFNQQALEEQIDDLAGRHQRSLQVMRELAQQLDVKICQTDENN